MNSHLLMGLAAALAAFSAHAQTEAPPRPVPRGAPVVSDAAPPPAEDRDSVGAVVMDPALRPLTGTARSDTRSMGAGPAPRPRAGQDGAAAAPGEPRDLRRKGAARQPQD